MEVEKRSSKGGFLQLFDWNVKSKKKLFANKSEFSEDSKQGKENLSGSAISRLQQVYENGNVLSLRGSSDYYYASSAAGDDGYGTKAPGLVARLMGLESLPTNVSEPCDTPFSEAHSFRDYHHLRNAIDIEKEHHHIVVYESMRNKLDGFIGNPVELRLQKVKHRPIDRFQTEVLPPKSAKPISITHHRMLSPIKSPGFIPPKNAAYIMEAAAKIIEQSPRSITKSKLSTIGSSSAPLRMKDLRERLEAAQKSSQHLEASQKSREHSSIKHMKRQPSGRGHSRSEDKHLLKGSQESKNPEPQNLKIREKSPSLAVQAKSNLQKREGPSSSDKKLEQKEGIEVKSARAARKQINRNLEKRTSDVLRQNNQKQNRASVSSGESSKPAVLNPKSGPPSLANEFRPNRSVNRIVVKTGAGSRKTNPVTVDSEKEYSVTRRKPFPKKKQLVNGDIRSDRSVSDTSPKTKDEGPMNSKAINESCNSWDTLERKNGMDVVSFTFTSPIKKTASGSSSPGQVEEKRNRPSLLFNTLDNQSEPKSSAVTLGSGDALSILLEEKLKELTSRVGSSHEEQIKAVFMASSASSTRDSVPVINVWSNMSSKCDSRFALNLQEDSQDIQFDISSGSAPSYNAMQIWQGLEEGDDCSTSAKAECERENNYSSSLSNLEPSLSECSCSSLDTNRSCSSFGNNNKQFTTVEAHEVDLSITREPHLMDGEVEFADSACSTFTEVMNTKGTNDAVFAMNSSCLWKLEYIRDVYSEAELRVEEFALGQAHKIIDPYLFDQLEDQNTGLNKYSEDHMKLERKVLFDCMEEYLECRCKQHFSGSLKAWAKWRTSLLRKEFVAEDLYREICGWTSMEDLMVDEVVDKDMSTQRGKWVDFEIEAFEEGIELENGILTSLITELVDDFLQY